MNDDIITNKVKHHILIEFKCLTSNVLFTYKGEKYHLRLTVCFVKKKTNKQSDPSATKYKKLKGLIVEKLLSVFIRVFERGPAFIRRWGRYEKSHVSLTPEVVSGRTVLLLADCRP